MNEDNVISLVSRRKIKALDHSITELTEVTTVIKSAMQGLSKYIHYSDIKKEVNNLLVLHQALRTSRQKKQEILERLKNE